MSANAGESDGVTWNLFSVPATIDSDPKASGVCFTIELEPPDGTEVDVSDLSSDELYLGRPVMSCQPVADGTVGITAIQPLTWSFGGNYTWLAATTLPGVESVTFAAPGGRDTRQVPAVSGTIVWVSPDANGLPITAQLNPLNLTCDLRYEALTYLAECPPIAPG